MALAEGLLTTPGGTNSFTASLHGTLALQVGSALALLAWIDRTSAQVGALGDRAAFFEVALSPDRSRIVASVSTSISGVRRDIWIRRAR